MSCQHRRPSSDREHSRIQSGDDDYLMNEIRRKPTTNSYLETARESGKTKRRVR